MSSRLSRYSTGPDELIQRIKNLEDTISRMERTPRTSNAAIDSGGLVVNGGDIIIRDNDGNDIIRMFQDDPPEIRFTPLGEDTTHVGSVYAQDEVINGTTQTATYFAIRNTPALAFDGGGLKVFNDGVKLFHITNSSGEESAFEAGLMNGTQGVLHCTGRWLNFIQNSASDGIATGSFTTGAVSSFTITHAVAYATIVAPIIGLVSAAGAVSFSLTAQSVSSFTVAWSGGAAVKTINWWGVRL